MHNSAAKSALAASPSSQVAATGDPAVPRHVRGTALLASLGLVCGAVFWHAIGLFSSMSDLVTSAKSTAAHEMQQSGEQIETGSLADIHRVEAATCTGLELDRRTNRTATRPCPREGLALSVNGDETPANLASVSDSGVP